MSGERSPTISSTPSLRRTNPDEGCLWQLGHDPASALKFVHPRRAECYYHAVRFGEGLRSGVYGGIHLFESLTGGSGRE